MKEHIDELIEQSLKMDHGFELSPDFKDRVTRIILKKERRKQRKLYLLIAIGVIVIFGFGLSVVAYFGSLQSVLPSNDFLPIAVVVGSLIVLIQYLDKRLVKDKFFKQLV